MTDDIETVRKQVVAWTPQHSGGWRGECCARVDEALAALDRIATLKKQRDEAVRDNGLWQAHQERTKKLAEVTRRKAEARIVTLTQERDMLRKWGDDMEAQRDVLFAQLREALERIAGRACHVPDGMGGCSDPDCGNHEEDS